MLGFDPPLPIDAVLDDIAGALSAGSRLVVVAPPGAGKTTRIPLVLLRDGWAAGKRIILLELRRLAARAAAERMASTLGERVGETVGLRMRLETKVSTKTRIEVVTEGVFARLILDDPSLADVAAVLFDEFHERSLDADLGLALALDAQSGLRDDLRLLVMSATLDGARVASLMKDAPVIESAGRAYPVETRYLGRDSNERIEDAVTRAVLRALRSDAGSLLVFLPGQGEITRTAERLAAQVNVPAVDVVPLYGALERQDQDRAIAPALPGRRKIVLATSIAETSLTIEGVRVVIDSGLSRVPRYEAGIGLTRLETVRVSRAAADQRRGRAGRTEPGVCYRLWQEAANGALEPFARPEILDVDLSGLVLDLAHWGVRNPLALAWLDPPPMPAWNEACALLRRLGALDEQGAITEAGRRVRDLPLPPRLARMVIEAATHGQAEEAARIAALLSERGLAGSSTDLADRLERLARDRSPRAAAVRRLAAGWARAAASAAPEWSSERLSVGGLVAYAYPERVAKARGERGQFLMANGRAATLEPHDALASAPYLAIAEVAGRADRARIFAAAGLPEAELLAIEAGEIATKTETSFDRERLALRARRVSRLGAIALSQQNLPVETGPESARILAQGIATTGIDRLPWTSAQKQLRDRVAFLRAAEGEEWPDLSDAALAANANETLAPFLGQRTSVADIAAEDLDQVLGAVLPWNLKRRLEQEAPTHFTTPAGSSLPIDYEAEGGPTISVRVQELYGLSMHPAIAAGRVPLVLALLSPAHRPIQITRDLPGFWRGSWAAIRAEMRGRYPKHVWPENPAAAAPTTRAKPRGT
ncbi:MAG TPA: ATP-dependent helicase HrpB [Beijerinckiaceae bacterium]|jgi:ATP-dependent helicase HrpB|nr:ATP-dependent helicase HrpB [Beijerinckiaceae bacterium]